MIWKDIAVYEKILVPDVVVNILAALLKICKVLGSILVPETNTV
jgi:hypothetical protein